MSKKVIIAIDAMGGENSPQKIIDGIIAIRVLDEGFDIPACQQAFLFASTRNERQFIQRRGRILRKSNNKSKSIIHDFLVLIDDYGDAKELVEKELERAYDFNRIAINKDKIEVELNKIAKNYHIDFEKIKLDIPFFASTSGPCVYSTY